MFGLLRAHVWLVTSSLPVEHIRFQLYSREKGLWKQELSRILTELPNAAQCNACQYTVMRGTHGTLYRNAESMLEACVGRDSCSLPLIAHCAQLVQKQRTTGIACRIFATLYCYSLDMN